MNTNRITVRYAKALYEFAEEQNKTDKVRKDTELISEVLKNSDFKKMLETPVVFPSKKYEIFKEIFKNKLDDITLKFFKLLTDNKREKYLPTIILNYADIYRKENGIKSAEIITVFDIDDKLKTEVAKILSEKFKSKIEITSKTDKDITGGFILTVDGMQYDASIKGKLKEIKKEMLEA